MIQSASAVEEEAPSSKYETGNNVNGFPGCYFWLKCGGICRSAGGRVRKELRSYLRAPPVRYTGFLRSSAHMAGRVGNEKEDTATAIMGVRVALGRFRTVGIASCAGGFEASYLWD